MKKIETPLFEECMLDSKSITQSNSTGIDNVRWTCMDVHETHTQFIYETMLEAADALFQQEYSTLTIEQKVEVCKATMDIMQEHYEEEASFTLSQHLGDFLFA